MVRVIKKILSCLGFFKEDIDLKKIERLKQKGLKPIF